jgi:hypothetical protein
MMTMTMRMTRWYDRSFFNLLPSLLLCPLLECSGTILLRS